MVSFDPPVAATIPNARKLAQELIETEAHLGELAAATKAAEARRNYIRGVELPSILAELELTSIGIGNHVIAMIQHVDASLPKDPDKRRIALDWLHANGHSGVLKHMVVADMPTGDDATAAIAVDALESIGIGARVELNVHPMTYKAVAREIVRSGQVAPLDDLGIYIGNMAVVES